MNFLKLRRKNHTRIRRVYVVDYMLLLFLGKEELSLFYSRSPNIFPAKDIIFKRLSLVSNSFYHTQIFIYHDKVVFD